MLTPKEGALLFTLTVATKFYIFNYLLYLLKENNLLQTLPIESQCSGKEGQLVKYVYSTKLSRV